MPRKNASMQIATPLAVVLLASSCSNESGNEYPPNLKSADGAVASILSGAWSTLCLSLNNDSYTKKFTFSKSAVSPFSLTYSYIEKRYSANTSCSGDPALVNQNGTYTTGDLLTAASGVDVREIDFFYRKNAGVDTQTYNILNISDNNSILYLGETSSNLPPNRPTDLHYDSPFFNDTAPTTAVTFYNDMGFSISSVFIKLSSDKSDTRKVNKINSPIPPGRSITLSVACDEKFSISIEADSGVIEERENAQVSCNKRYSWPIDGS